MHTLVINGSPKGKHSVTLQTVSYWQLLFPEQSFEILHVGQTIKALEKDLSPPFGPLRKPSFCCFAIPYIPLSLHVSCIASLSF